MPGVVARGWSGAIGDEWLGVGTSDGGHGNCKGERAGRDAGGTKGKGNGNGD